MLQCLIVVKYPGAPLVQLLFASRFEYIQLDHDHLWLLKKAPSSLVYKITMPAIVKHLRFQMNDCIFVSSSKYCSPCRCRHPQ